MNNRIIQIEEHQQELSKECQFHLKPQLPLSAGKNDVLSFIFGKLDVVFEKICTSFASSFPNHGFVPTALSFGRLHTVFESSSLLKSSLLLILPLRELCDIIVAPFRETAIFLPMWACTCFKWTGFGCSSLSNFFWSCLLDSTTEDFLRSTIFDSTIIQQEERLAKIMPLARYCSAYDLRVRFSQQQISFNQLKWV